MVTGSLFEGFIFMTPAIGIITFLGVLMLTNETSGDPNFSKGEVRKAIAASFIAVYFVVVSAIVFSPNFSRSPLGETIIMNLTLIILTVVGFYFGFRGLQDVMNARRGQGSQNV